MKGNMDSTRPTFKKYWLAAVSRVILHCTGELAVFVVEVR